MDIAITIMDSTNGIAHRSRQTVDALMLAVVSEPRQDMAREKGPDWTHGAITFFGLELAKAIQLRVPSVEIDRLVMNLAIAVWVFSSVFEGLTAENFVDSNLSLTVTPDGMVRCERLAKSD